MAPSSYQAPTRKDSTGRHSQSTKTNLAVEAATVEKLIAQKGNSVYAIRPGDTLNQAVQVLAEKRIGALMVTDDDGMMQGILSERDIVRKLAETPGTTLPQTVGENMTRNVVSCSPDDLLVTVLQRMNEGRFRHMPVLEDGVLMGMLTIGDVVGFRLRELEHEALQLKQLIVG
ncbi:MAG: CBS domain-containing protein [Pseudomonadota bacterium]